MSYRTLKKLIMQESGAQGERVFKEENECGMLY